MSRDLASELTTLRQKRGYLLPHHGLMAVSMPKLLTAYDALYTELALNERVLSRHEHEYVWMAILIACEEVIGTHHIQRFRVAGGTDAELEEVVGITALALGIESGIFVEKHWMSHLPGFEPRRTYFDAFAKLCDPSRLYLAHMSAAAVCTCKGNWEGLRWHLIGAYAAKADENGIAEALSVTMFPGGVPNFVEAADVWRELVTDGIVEAGEDFRIWAEMSGQGGFDEATGKNK